MKTLAILILSFLISFSTKAADYESVMKQTIEEMYQSQEADKLESIAARFYRIGETEKDRWLPYYYSAYSYVSITYHLEDGETIDKTLDKAQSMLDKAMALNPNESENHVLQGLIHSMRITSPMRGMTYSALSNEALEKAEKLNPENPRIWFCKAQNVFYTPAMFGGGAAKARPLYEKAAELFDTFEPQSEIWPQWGRELTESQLASIWEE
jgi:tetratricopeptide (TPR) repeat protein